MSLNPLFIQPWPSREVLNNAHAKIFLCWKIELSKVFLTQVFMKYYTTYLFGDDGGALCLIESYKKKIRTWKELALKK